MALTKLKGDVLPASPPAPPGRRVLVEIAHPAHVHFFARSLTELRRQGHVVHVVSRNKDITNPLLDRLGIPYRSLSSPARNLAGLALELSGRWYQTAKLIRVEKIDLAVSISGISTSVPARLCGARNIIFTDTEDARVSNAIAFAFADAIYTPTFFLQDLGSIHRRYFGVHELAYLQKFDFQGAGEIRKAWGNRGPYSVIRTVAHKALHDQDLKGMSAMELQALIIKLSELGRVVISAEGALPPHLESLRLSAPIEQIHAILAGAELFVGESPTMAVEASLLGTPAFLVSRRIRRLGNMISLERELQLLRNHASFSSLISELEQIKDFAALKRGWAVRAAHFRASATDVSQFVLETIARELASCAP